MNLNQELTKAIQKAKQEGRDEMLAEVEEALVLHASHTMQVTYGDGTTAEIGEDTMHIKDVQKLLKSLNQ
jgi:hypothetical protein